MLMVSQLAQSIQWLAADWSTEVQSQTKAEDFSSTLCAQLALGSTQPPAQWVTKVKCGRGVILTTHPFLILRLSKRGVIPPLPSSAFRGV
jgi:hypothetical protein